MWLLALYCNFYEVCNWLKKLWKIKIVLILTVILFLGLFGSLDFWLLFSAFFLAFLSACFSSFFANLTSSLLILGWVFRGRLVVVLDVVVYCVVDVSSVVVVRWVVMIFLVVTFSSKSSLGWQTLTDFFFSFGPKRPHFHD